MATLNGTQIGNTYPGLIKTTDNAILGAVEKEITDGDGNSSTLKLGTTSASFVGTLDLTGATVTGLPADTNTTYDLASAQDGANVDITLTGSDASIDTVQLTAGTNITLTEAAGSITIDAAGGGGGVELAEGQNITTGLGTTLYSIPWVLSGYSQSAGKAMTANRLQLVPFYAKPGESMSEFYFRVQTSVAASTVDVGLYKSYVATDAGSKFLYPEYVATIATGVSTATGGKKLFTGLDIAFPTDAYGGQYWIGFMPDTTGVSLTKWTNWVAAERSIYDDIYRANGTEKTYASSTLPTGQLDLSTGAGPSTDLCLDFAWRYKA